LPTAFTLICEVVVPVIEVGLKLTVTFLGRPEVESAIVGAPCITTALIVLRPVIPLTDAVRELGFALIVKLTAVDAVMESVTVAVLVNPPPVPETVKV